MDDKLIARIQRRMDADSDEHDEYLSYDDMVEMRWALPEGLVDLEGVVPFVDTGPHDAIKVACNIFDTYNPKWDILPRGPDDKDNAEKLERWLEWHMLKANQNSEPEVFREMMKYSTTYNRVCLQMDYLPYWLDKDPNKWTDEQKLEMENGPFCIVCHYPGNVYSERGKYGLRWVASVANIPASDMIDHWQAYSGKHSDEAKKIKKAIAEVEKLLEENDEQRLISVDFTDKKTRFVYCRPTERETVESDDLEGDDKIVFIDGENELGFINWVVVKGSGDSLLAAAHKGGLWNSVNISETIKRTNAHRFAFSAKFIEEGVGEDVQTDHSGVTDKLVVPPGKKVTPVPAIPLDPGFNELASQDRALLANSTSIQNLQSMGGGSNIQFATINAIIQISVTQLRSYVRTAEKALQELGKMAFLWVKKGEVSVMGMRRYTKGPESPAGEQIMVGPADFEHDKLYIEAKLIPNTPTDRLQLVNMAMQLVQAGFPIPYSEHMERLGYQNPEAMKIEWEEEQVEKMMLGLFQKEQDAALTLKLQQAQGALQMKNQPGQAPQSQQNSNPVIPQGMTPNQCGMSPMEAAPQMSQTQIAGATNEQSQVA